MISLRKTGFLILSALLIMATTSCFQYKEVEMEGVEDVRIKNLSAKGVEIEVDMKIKNPNNYKISIVDSDLDIYLKKKKMGNAIIQNKIVLPKKSSKVHTIMIKGDLKGMDLASLLGLVGIFGGGSLDVQMKGFIKAKAKGIAKKFPVDVTEKVSL